MGRFAVFLAALIGALIVTVLPDYIGLSIGFWSFLDHTDLTRGEVTQFGWLTVYCVAMAVSLVALAAAVILCFTKFAPRASWLVMAMGAVTLALACLHLGVLHWGVGSIAPRTAELFVAPAERHAWTTLAAGLLALLLLYLRQAAQSKRGAARRPSEPS